VIKALSAMRLCKEDCNPNAILARKKESPEGEQLFVPAEPTAEGTNMPSELAQKNDCE